eukprot:TRINITY_DN4734_c0_g1_i3.p1 TRINITY_DN4734_c0_g1~~TRINITY_DN4734_c0_g1_i3.p1  ORF type:complete len:310 (+),score=79.24 TRINITY_DN4734_c0_g1_i3:325-1254(+)
MLDFPEPTLANTSGSKPAFTQLCESIKTRHDNVVPMIAKGIMELKEQLSDGSEPPHTVALSPQVGQFLDRFFMSRIGLRVLLGQQIALTKTKTEFLSKREISHSMADVGDSEPNGQFVGIIQINCSASLVAQQAINDARDLCRLHLGVAPNVHIVGKDKDLTFCYIPTHLYHMLFELLKNSLRAVVEFHGAVANNLADDDLPPVKVVIAKGAEDVCIKIADEGGGIPRKDISQVWTYSYTTAQPPDLDDNYSTGGSLMPPLAGFGYGLPITRVYARYFGGDLTLNSMDGYGTDVYLHLNRLGTSSETIV